ncbi:hypothetical protein [Psychrobacter sp. 16-MNA-CIBAN-0192]|uniref:hypothetical protein n=1 Tax=Psychrobacter sp. 16-MNA-CIBAN-0192 TaxID=3140448 RepID=UPI0033239960
MKDYKLILVGLLILLLIVAIGIFTWLWQSNRKNTHPLPIAVSQNEQSATDNADSAPASVLRIQAENSMQVPLNDVIAKFEQRYPNVQLLVNYVAPSVLFTLPNMSHPQQNSSDFMVSIDIVIANSKISQTQLSRLQNILNVAQAERNASKINANGMTQETSQPNNIDPSINNDNNQARHLASFNYAIKGSSAVDGVILTENPMTSSFRNFLLSSSGQDVLKKHGYNDIDGYKNSVDELFNPASSHKRARGESSVKLTDALSNGQK